MAREAIVATREPAADLGTRRFYHGVETAALHVLRPEMAGVHEGTTWLEHRDPAFRDGFLEASSVLATAAAAADPPHHIRLPEPAISRR